MRPARARQVAHPAAVEYRQAPQPSSTPGGFGKRPSCRRTGACAFAFALAFAFGLAVAFALGLGGGPPAGGGGDGGGDGNDGNEGSGTLSCMERGVDGRDGATSSCMETGTDGGDGRDGTFSTASGCTSPRLSVVPSSFLPSSSAGSASLPEGAAAGLFFGTTAAGRFLFGAFAEPELRVSASVVAGASFLSSTATRSGAPCLPNWLAGAPAVSVQTGRCKSGCFTLSLLCPRWTATVAGVG